MFGSQFHTRHLFTCR